jgi:hypothetical protein
MGKDATKAGGYVLGDDGWELEPESEPEPAPKAEPKKEAKK